MTPTKDTHKRIRELDRDVTRYRIAYEAALARAERAEERHATTESNLFDARKRITALEKEITRIKEDNRIMRLAMAEHERQIERLEPA